MKNWQVKIYTTNYCGFCRAAVALLKSHNISFKEIDVTSDNAARAMLRETTGRHTVPQIFIDEKSIGGYSELRDILPGLLEE